jgi:hypothetical protein
MVKVVGIVGESIHIEYWGAYPYVILFGIVVYLAYRMVKMSGQFFKSADLALVIYAIGTIPFIYHAFTCKGCGIPTLGLMTCPQYYVTGSIVQLAGILFLYKSLRIFWVRRKRNKVKFVPMP